MKMKVATTISHSMALIQFFKAQLPDLKSPPPACYTVRMPPSGIVLSSSAMAASFLSSG